MKITTARCIKGRVSLPGDKSISHRAAIIAALANGTSQISNFSPSEDCAATIRCLKKLGVSIQTEANELIVEGAGEAGLRASSATLDCGNSGTTIRLMAGALAGHNFSSTLSGDASLRLRPMQRIIEPLERMGAKVNSENGKPPLIIHGTSPLMPIRYDLPVASAQVKSCLLLAGLHADGRTELIESRGATRDHTERMLEWFGVPLHSGSNQGQPIAIDGPAEFSARDLIIPGDISSAAFLIAAAAMLPDSDLEIEGVGLNPTRARFLITLRSFGFDVDITGEREICNEPVGNLRVRGNEAAGGAKSNSVRGRLVAELIDELPILAVVGSQLPGGLEIRDAAELRHKETDRIDAIVRNLRAMGAEIEEFDDGLKVSGPAQLHGATIDSFTDHRIAMAFTIAALIAEGDSELVDADCVGVSFPGFFEVLGSLIER